MSDFYKGATVRLSQIGQGRALSGLIPLPTGASPASITGKITQVEYFSNSTEIKVLWQGAAGDTIVPSKCLELKSNEPAHVRTPRRYR